jgi:hypothetical protein
MGTETAFAVRRRHIVLRFLAKVLQGSGLYEHGDICRLAGAALADRAMADIAIVEKDFGLVADTPAQASACDLRCFVVHGRKPSVAGHTAQIFEDIAGAAEFVQDGIADGARSLVRLWQQSVRDHGMPACGTKLHDSNALTALVCGAPQV